MQVVDPNPGDLPMSRVKSETPWRPNRIGVEKPWDEMWVGVKGQSNPEIAGSPRNSFRASLELTNKAVEH